MVTCKHSLAVDGDTGGDKGDRASGNHDVTACDGATDVDAAGEAVLDGVGIHQLALTNENVLFL